MIRLVRLFVYKRGHSKSYERVCITVLITIGLGHANK